MSLAVELFVLSVNQETQQTLSLLYTVLLLLWQPRAAVKFHPRMEDPRSQAHELTIIQLFSQPWVTLSRLTETLLPISGLSYSKANNLGLPLAKPGRRDIPQIQKVNSIFLFLNLVNKVHGFATTECIHSTILVLALKSCTKLQHLLSKLESKLQKVTYYFFYPPTVP